MLKTLLLSTLALFFCAAGARAQGPGNIESPLGSTKPRQPDSVFGSPEEEMKYRALVKHAEGSHKEMLVRAREGAQLASEIRSSFERAKSLSAEDVKKLERVEKLARKIRGSAGGDDDKEILQNPPAQLEGALSRLDELSAELLKKVQKTSRFVTSAAVVERSNELIELVRHIRALTR